MTATNPQAAGPFGQGPYSLVLPATITDFVAGPAGITTQLAAGFDLRTRFSYAVGTANMDVVRLGSTTTSASSTWQIQVLTNGNVQGVIRTGGGASTTPAITVAQLGNPAPGAWLTVRFVYDVATGQRTGWLSSDNGATWTQVGAAGTATAPFALNVDPTWQLKSGGTTAATTRPGGLAWVDLRAFDGTPLASVDLTWLWPGIVWTDPQGHTWTLQGTGWQWAGPVAITTTSLPLATVGQPYTAQLHAVAGTPPYSWSVTDGTLPPGLSLDPATGEITGTPT